MRARLLDQRAQVAHVRRRAHEREGDEVHAELERKVEVVHVLPRQRGNRDRNAREVDSLVRADDPTDQHGAARAALLDRLDAKPDEAVVDEDLVPGLKHLADHRRADGQLAVGRGLAPGHDHVLPTRQRDWALELADAELRALEVGDQGDRPAGLGLGRANEPGALAMLVVRAVREVEAGAVHAGPRELRQQLGRRGGGTDRGDDLRSSGRHYRHTPSVARRGASD